MAVKQTKSFRHSFSLRAVFLVLLALPRSDALLTPAFPSSARRGRHQHPSLKARRPPRHKRQQHEDTTTRFLQQDELDDDDDGWMWESDQVWEEEDTVVAKTASSNQQPHDEPSSHFFSRKRLDDPSFLLQQSADAKLLLNQLCAGVGITRPSKIQSLAWPILLQGRHAILADQTGSGKTLAYLVPLLQRALLLKRSKRGGPRILVLAPTSELADQIHAVCIKLQQQGDASFCARVVTASGTFGATNIRDQIRMLQRRDNIDVLISTPGRLATILRTKGQGGLDLSHLQALVLDEVDVLLSLDDNTDEKGDEDAYRDPRRRRNSGASSSSSFAPQLATIAGCMSVDDNTQFVFCTATLPDNIVDVVQNEFQASGDLVQVRGPGLHRVAPTVTERLVDVSVPASAAASTAGFDIKAQELLKALRQTKCRRTLVFCNTVETCRKVENLLQRRDRNQRVYQVLPYHNAMTPQARNQNLKTFCGQRQQERSNSVEQDAILICTDRAARGVDFDAAPVQHVVLFDFPKDPAEYVRRVGRTARAGRGGTCTVLAYGWQLPIARSVMNTNSLEYTSSTNTLFSDENEYESKNSRKKQRRRNQSDAFIRNNIERGTLWSGGTREDKQRRRP